MKAVARVAVGMVALGGRVGVAAKEEWVDAVVRVANLAVRVANLAARAEVVKARAGPAEEV